MQSATKLSRGGAPLGSVPALENGSRFVKHRGVDFDVEEDQPGLWRWKIYPKIEAGPKVIGEAKYRSRKPPLLPPLKRSITALREADVAAAPTRDRLALGPVSFGAPS